MAALSEVRAALAKLLSRARKLRPPRTSTAAAQNDRRRKFAALDARSTGTRYPLCHVRPLQLRAQDFADVRRGGIGFPLREPLCRGQQGSALTHSPPSAWRLAAFEDAHWSALLPAQPLRYWHLVEVLPGDTLTASPLRIDERILHYLAGVPSLRRAFARSHRTAERRWADCRCRSAPWRSRWPTVGRKPTGNRVARGAVVRQ